MPPPVKFFYIFTNVIQQDPRGSMYFWVSGVCVSFERPLGCSGTPALYFYILISLFCLLFALTSACNTKEKCHSINSEDLHYGALPRFPSILWSARELVPLLTFIISLRTVPIETFLSEAVPTCCLELHISLRLVCLCSILFGCLTMTTSVLVSLDYCQNFIFSR